MRGFLLAWGLVEKSQGWAVMLWSFWFGMAEADEEGDELDCQWDLRHSFVEEWDIFIPAPGWVSRAWARVRGDPRGGALEGPGARFLINGSVSSSKREKVNTKRHYII
jgi:hypothetical protein